MVFRSCGEMRRWTGRRGGERQAVKRVRFRAGERRSRPTCAPPTSLLICFIVAGLGFLLPFVTLSCSGQRLVTVTGVQLVTGVDVGSHGSPSDARAAFALGMCVLGVLLLKAAGTAGRIPAALAGAAGAIALLSFKTTLDDEVLRQGHGVIRVQYEFGYYLVLVALASAAAAGFWNPVPHALPGAIASKGVDKSV